MIDLFWFRLPRSHWPSQPRLCLGLLVILLMFGLALNTLFDTDCFQIQTATCCCNADSTDQDTDVQADICSHCTGWLPVYLPAGQSAVLFTDLPFDNPADPVPGILHLERPPIFS